MEQFASSLIAEKLGERVLSTDLQSNLTVVRMEIERLGNAILHLRRSNDELGEEDPSDPDFAAAIRENTQIIVKYTRKVTELQELLDVLKGVPGGSASCETSRGILQEDERAGRQHHQQEEQERSRAMEVEVEQRGAASEEAGIFL